MAPDISDSTFRCGHERTPENSVRNGKTGTTCRTCNNERHRQRYAANLEQSRAAVRERMRKHRGGLKGHRNERKTHCPNGHSYDAENTYLTPDGSRQCKTCRREHVRQSYEKNRDKYIPTRRLYYAANREKVLAANRQWVKDNPERAALISRLKKHRRRNAGVLTSDDWGTVLNVYDHRCLACGADETTIDHVIPVSKGGTNTIDNVQPLCRDCNTRKGVKTIDYRPAMAILTKE